MLTTILNRLHRRGRRRSQTLRPVEPEPTIRTDEELNAIQAADLVVDAAIVELNWTRDGALRVACVGCDAEFHVPLLFAASPAYCRSNHRNCFPSDS